MSRNEKETVARYRARLKKYGHSKETLGWFKGKQDIRYRALIKDIPADISSIIDVGCGFGDGIPYIAEKFTDLHYTGIDMVPEFIENAKARFQQHDFVCGDYIKFEPKKRLGAIIASGIFNHNTTTNYQDVEQLIKYCKQVEFRYLAFDVMSNIVDFKNKGNFYHDPTEIIGIITKHSRRFKLSHLEQPFEYTIFIDMNDDFDSVTSKYVK